MSVNAVLGAVSLAISKLSLIRLCGYLDMEFVAFLVPFLCVIEVTGHVLESKNWHKNGMVERKRFYEKRFKSDSGPTLFHSERHAVELRLAPAKPPQVPKNVPELQKMFKGPQLGCYRKIGGTQVRKPTYAEIAKNAVLVTYVDSQCGMPENQRRPPGANTYKVETKGTMTKDHLIARNPDIIGLKNGKPVYNEWLIKKSQFFTRYGASESDLKFEFKAFHKKVPLQAIEITDEVIKILGGSNGRATIKTGWSEECMELEKGGLLTEEYGVSKFNRKEYEKISACKKSSRTGSVQSAKEISGKCVVKACKPRG